MNPAIEARLHLLASNRDWISVALARVVADGGDIKQLVVLILDTTDNVGGGIARALAERHPKLGVEHHERVVLGKRQIPTVIAVVPVPAAELLFAETHPGVAGGLGIPPPCGRVRVVSVASGGATLLHLPTAALRTLGTS